MPESTRIFWLYIVKCRDSSFYTGIAADVEARVERHNSGRGAKYTASRRPVRLVFRERCGTRSSAMKREYQIKQLSRAEKAALVRQYAHDGRRRADVIGKLKKRRH